LAGSFEEWARAEISRLRTEADALQRALDKYLESQPKEARETAPSAPITRVRRAPKKARKGSKRQFVLGRIGESGERGSSIEELFSAVQETFPEMKRSSLRALLYLENKEGHIARLDNGRYVSSMNREGLGAPTPSPPKLF
jgi:hypothetical protein